MKSICILLFSNIIHVTENFILKPFWIAASSREQFFFHWKPWLNKNTTNNAKFVFSFQNTQNFIDFFFLLIELYLYLCLLFHVNWKNCFPHLNFPLFFIFMESCLLNQWKINFLGVLCSIVLLQKKIYIKNKIREYL